MFIDTKWSYPYEQTWMSHIFQLTKKNEIKPAILLATPTEHNRFEHYSAECECLNEPRITRFKLILAD